MYRMIGHQQRTLLILYALALAGFGVPSAYAQDVSTALRAARTAICHKPGPKQRILSVDDLDVVNHLGHGDFVVSTEACDEIDNDCDGTIDEGPTGEPLARTTTCGVGSCAGNTGVETCTNGKFTGDTCNPTAGASAELCDGIDNDCDGTVDDEPTDLAPCAGTCSIVAGLGLHQSCVDGTKVCALFPNVCAPAICGQPGACGCSGSGDCGNPPVCIEGESCGDCPSSGRCHDGALPDQTCGATGSPFTSSNLPIIVIDTGGARVRSTEKVTAEMGIIGHADLTRNRITDACTDLGPIGIEIRGQSSAGFGKKPFGIETRDEFGENRNVPLFGWPAENDWVLNGPYSDKTLIRNLLTFKWGTSLAASSASPGRWTPRTQPVEVILNGNYLGIYVVFEKIKRDDGRVDIANLKPEDTSGRDVTGGYLMKIDKPSFETAESTWNSKQDSCPHVDGLPDCPSYAHNLPFRMQDPSLIGPEQQAYIESFMDAFEATLAGSGFADPDTGYAKYIDVPSFVDFFIMNELTKNIDGYRISTFMYKDKDPKPADGPPSKLVMGPLWDFNLTMGNGVQGCDGEGPTGWQADFNITCLGEREFGGLKVPFWWTRLREDPNFCDQVLARWQLLRAGPLSDAAIMDDIDQLVADLAEARDRNFERYPAIFEEWVIGNHLPLFPSFDDELVYLEDWLAERLEWLDANMPGCPGQ